ncbi:hypothetical protein [Nocardia sp. bgisy118]|uniref:hypothetical protein n=1 Tax=Nocardia sp. bgisy118 TaxID=3413786 RepID=UPI003F4A61C6
MRQRIRVQREGVSKGSHRGVDVIDLAAVQKAIGPRFTYIAESLELSGVGARGGLVEQCDGPIEISWSVDPASTRRERGPEIVEQGASARGTGVRGGIRHHGTQQVDRFIEVGAAPGDHGPAIQRGTQIPQLTVSVRITRICSIDPLPPELDSRVQISFVAEQDEPCVERVHQVGNDPGAIRIVEREDCLGLVQGFDGELQIGRRSS